MVLHCPYCEKELKNKKKLDSHIRNVHLDKLTFQCRYCNRKRYATWKELDDHHRKCVRQLPLKNTPLKFECKWCDKKYRTTQKLNRHIYKQHKDRLPFVCKCGRRYETDLELKSHEYCEKLQEIRVRGLARGAKGENRWPRHIEKENRTHDEVQEHEDAIFLRNKSQEPPVNTRAKRLWDEIFGWKPSTNETVKERLLAIKERGLVRAAAGGRRWPRMIRRKNRTACEDLECRDAQFLRNMRGTPPTSGIEKALWDEMMPWWLSTIEDGLAQIKKRGLMREAAGGKRWPEMIQKRNRTESEEQARKDLMYIQSIAKYPPIAGNAKVLWDEIIGWKPSNLELVLACQKCELIFNTRKKLNSHLRRDHGVQGQSQQDSMHSSVLSANPSIEIRGNIKRKREGKQLFVPRHFECALIGRTDDLKREIKELSIAEEEEEMQPKKRKHQKTCALLLKSDASTEVKVYIPSVYIELDHTVRQGDSSVTICEFSLPGTYIPETISLLQKAAQFEDYKPTQMIPRIYTEVMMILAFIGAKDPIYKHIRKQINNSISELDEQKALQLKRMIILESVKFKRRMKAPPPFLLPEALFDSELNTRILDVINWNEEAPQENKKQWDTMRKEIEPIGRGSIDTLQLEKVAKKFKKKTCLFRREWFETSNLTTPSKARLFRECYFPGWTSLYSASKNGNESLVRDMVECGADINAKDSRTWTSLHYASSNGHDNVVRALVELGADIHAKSSSGWTSLHHASWNGHDNVVRALVELGADIHAKDSEGWTSLHYASTNGHDKVVRALVELGADVHAKDSNGWTCLHYASLDGHDNVVRTLVELGADIHAKDSSEFKSLHYASRHGRDNVVRALVELGADIDVKDSSGETSLLHASRKCRGKVVRSLVVLDADIHAKDSDDLKRLNCEGDDAKLSQLSSQQKRACSFEDGAPKKKRMTVVPAFVADRLERSFRISSPEPVSTKRSAEMSELSSKNPKKIKKDSVPPPREAGGGRRWPRHIRKKNRTDSEEQEYKDATYLNNRSQNPLSNSTVSRETVEEKLLAIKERGLKRAAAGGRRWPRQISKQNRTDSEKEQEQKDSKYLNDRSKNPPSSGNAKTLWDELMGWKPTVARKRKRKQPRDGDRNAKRKKNQD